MSLSRDVRLSSQEMSCLAMMSYHTLEEAGKRIPMPESLAMVTILVMVSERENGVLVFLRSGNECVLFGTQALQLQNISFRMKMRLYE